MNHGDVLQEFKELTLGYNEQFATIEIYEEEQLLFSVFESNPQNANWEYVGAVYLDVFHAIQQVRIGQVMNEIQKQELV